MKFETSSDKVEKISSDGTVIFFFQNKKGFTPVKSFKSLSSAHQQTLNIALALSKFKAKAGEIVAVPFEKGSLISQVLAVGLGKKEDFDQNELRKTSAAVAKAVKGKANSLVLPIAEESEFGISAKTQAQIITEGIALGSYSFGKYQKKEEGEDELEVVAIHTNKSILPEVKEGIEMGEIYSSATILARDLVNEPAEVVTPTHLANFAQDLAKGNKDISVKIFDREEAQKLGMNAFLGIARGADTPPKFIYLHYKQKNVKNKRKLAIVGKGITFDSGGINVKPGDSMQTMKEDMSGAAAVLAVFSVISAISPSFEVMGLIAATPNLISGKSIVPGDIVKAMNGKTIEVLNTDAEGRVTMADSLSFAVKEGATEIIDLATLTGAIQIALGLGMAGLFSNNKELSNRVSKASQETGEKVWGMPLPKEYKELNKSEVADIANIPNTRHGGAITAALFLQEFVDDKPWVHLDIAPTAFAEHKFDLGPKGGTGFGVRLLLHYIQNSK